MVWLPVTARIAFLLEPCGVCAAAVLSLLRAPSAACYADNEDERNRIERFNPNPKLPLVGSLLAGHSPCSHAG